MRARNIRSFKDFHAWWNKVITLKVKAIVLSIVTVGVVVVSFQYQVATLADQRLDDACDSRVIARKDLREVLMYVIDLSSLFPGDVTAEQYTENRRDFINENYKPIVKGVDC